VSVEKYANTNSLFIGNSYSLARFRRKRYKEQSSGETDPVHFDFSVFS